MVLLDSIAEVAGDDAGRVVVSASHGGVSASDYAARHPLRGAFFNDAGIGKDRAGIAGLMVLEAAGIPAAAYSHRSARIGDARDAWANGIVSAVNPLAASRGVSEGMSVREAAGLLLSGSRAAT